MINKVTVLFCALLLGSSSSFAKKGDTEAEIIKKSFDEGFFKATNLQMPACPPAPSLRASYPLTPPPPTAVAFKKQLNRPALGDLKRQSVWLNIASMAAEEVAAVQAAEAEEYDTGTMCIDHTVVDDRLKSVQLKFNAHAEKVTKQEVQKFVLKLKTGETLSPLDKMLLKMDGFLMELNNELCQVGKNDRPSHKPKRRIFSIFERNQLNLPTLESKSLFTQEVKPAPIQAVKLSPVQQLINFWSNPMATRTVINIR